MPQSMSMGQTIKKLRKERNLTQEELAEQLNVTFQAVSKWENETGLPDISQVVPLASVFGVSTDVLFGTFGTNENEEAEKIIREAYAPGGDNSQKRIYDALQEGLKRYPNNIMLLVNSLERGIALAYPENGPDSYDEIHGEEIYKECIRQANLIVSYSKNGGDILRAHMIMILLHSAYGESEKAREHLGSFPVRTDLTFHNMHGWISHAEKNYSAEAYHWQMDFGYRLTAMFDVAMMLGKAYRSMGKYGDALEIFFSVFSFMDAVFKGEKMPPPVPNTDSGDVYAEIARTYMEMDDIENALGWLGKMVDCEMAACRLFSHGIRVETPFLRDVEFAYYHKGSKKKLLGKLGDAAFDGIKDDGRFVALLDMANAMED